MGEMESRAGRLHGKRVAVEYGGKRLSYEELERRSNRVASWLRKRGVGPEVFVGLYLERDLEAVVWMVGIVKAGGAYVPMDVSYPSERVIYMAQDAGLKLCVSQKGLKEKLGGVEGLEVVDVEEDETDTEEGMEEANSDAERPEGTASTAH